MSFEHERDLDKQTVRVRLDILSGEMHEEDIALTNELRQDILNIHSLGTIVPTGEEKVRGGLSPIDILVALQGVATYVSIHRDDIEHLLNDSAALVSICGGVTPLIRSLFESHKKRVDTEGAPLKVTLEIKQGTTCLISVEAKDVEGAEAGIKLAQKLYQQYPTQAPQISTRSSVRVTAQPSKQAQRKRGHR